jgi:hypothetical protein
MDREVPAPPEECDIVGFLYFHSFPILPKSGKAVHP